MDSLLNFRLSWFLICLSALTGVSAAEQVNATFPSWHEFKPDDGHFSIQFPSAPTLQTTYQDSVIGHVTNHIFVAKINNSSFGVDYSDLPGFALSFISNGTLYSHATGALLKKTLGKLVSSKDIQYHGHSGKHLIYDIPPVPDVPEMYGEAYLFLLDRRLYVIDATAPADASRPQVQHFLNSLRFD